MVSEHQDPPAARDHDDGGAVGARLKSGTTIVTILAAFVAAVLLVKLLVVSIEARLAFFPLRGIDATPRDRGIPYEELDVTTSDGETINAWLMTHESPAAEVLYFHGNGGNLSVWLPILEGIHRRGLTVLAVDYRGYGKSSGAPSERGLQRDAEAIVARFWERRTSRTPVIYWGRSLGASIGAYAATKRPPDGLILESGFPSASAIVRTNPIMAALALFSSYTFPTARLLERVDRPVLVIHGDRDSIIPFPLGEELFAAIKTDKRFYRIPGGDHNDSEPPDADAYWTEVRGFISRVREARRAS